MKGVYEMTEDSGWKTFPLASGVTAYSSAQVPQYRKIGNTVYLRGAVGALNTEGKVLGTLPTGYRPSQVHPYVQNTSKSGDSIYFTRMKVNTNGDVSMDYTDAVLANASWYPITTSFLVD
jgi:hypothetical protein